MKSEVPGNIEASFGEMLVGGRNVKEDAIEAEFTQQHQRAIKGAKALQKKANPNTNTNSEAGVKKTPRKT